MFFSSIPPLSVFGRCKLHPGLLGNYINCRETSDGDTKSLGLHLTYLAYKLGMLPDFQSLTVPTWLECAKLAENTLELAIHH